MNFRYYTIDDYVNCVPCIYKYRDHTEPVFPVCVSGERPFDGSRKLTVKTIDGRFIERTIGGTDLKQVFYAAC